MIASPVYSYVERMEWMLKARSLLDDRFYPRIAYQQRWVVLSGSKQSVDMQRISHVDVVLNLVQSNHQDTIIQIKDGTETLFIDEKLDSKNRSTIFCETISVQEKQKPGWMVEGVSKSDVLLWAFCTKRPVGLKVYMWWLEPLIKWFWARLDWFDEYAIKNKEGDVRWMTIGRQVRIQSIPQELYFRKPEIVTAQLSLFGD